MEVCNAKDYGLESLNKFFREERKSFPKYFKMKELRAQYEKGNLYLIISDKGIFAFYVLEGEKFKNLYIPKVFRKTRVIEMVVEYLQKNNKILTIAINENSRRMKKFCKKYNFFPTDKVVQGKESKLTIYKYERFDFIEKEDE